MATAPSNLHVDSILRTLLNYSRQRKMHCKYLRDARQRTRSFHSTFYKPQKRHASIRRQTVWHVGTGKNWQEEMLPSVYYLFPLYLVSCIVFLYSFEEFGSQSILDCFAFLTLVASDRSNDEEMMSHERFAVEGTAISSIHLIKNRKRM